MIEGVIIAVLVSMVMVVIRGILGSTVFDRILAANLFGTKIVVFIVLIGHFMETEFFLDVALTYALINFITTIALLRYFKFEDSRE
ncbi:MAG: monovalent cation/H+ antiporter complex subunit F [Rickettsiales bacterium]|nr:monovalent cation/H+ antiporter complex subunit F [Pseudomonadota bacterium]MDA0967265.1 monovalent cation/H+ antiporter complex subunit F [Pseudomonadota bacterium]MDG4544074.1 monovalent cation/H+ antiporter complex subunit F [Rickettsiales bacterium]MDG4546232.1 monovalent cation/H+ antiporter complex subunit F [Rickettsiales bacterium]MDG4548398.1 monovalent cation/H+ antiporter complex subunit F [Rickettsiales bacterium]